MLRIPPLPPVWITGKGESLMPQSKSDGNLQDDASSHLVTRRQRPRRKRPERPAEVDHDLEISI
jgi:hypothetical protein